VQHEQPVSPTIWHGAQRPPDGTGKSFSERLRAGEQQVRLSQPDPQRARVTVTVEIQCETGNPWWPLECPLLVERAAREAWARRDRA
jgi:hypothetical protein